MMFINEGRPDADVIKTRIDGLQEKWRELNEITGNRYVLNTLV